MNPWHLQCGFCSQNLRILVPDEKLGKTLDVTCPVCERETRITIGGVPDEALDLLSQKYVWDPNLPYDVNEAAKEIVSRVSGDPAIRKAFKVISNAGLSPTFLFAILSRENGDKPPENPKFENRVDANGDIKPGTFSPSDDEELKRIFKIKL